MRGQRNFDHRLACAWCRFSELGHTLRNRRIPVHLRLKLFDSVVSPTVLFSLSTTPLTATQLEKLDAVQRKMMRHIVGWTRYEDEDWDETGRRMKHKLEAALRRHPVTAWSQARARQRHRLLAKLAAGNAPEVVCHVFQWFLNPRGGSPLAYRGPGRPPCRWTSF